MNTRPVTVDFETFGIEGRPAYPPKPVGVAIKYPGKKSVYYAFGHPTNNNCTEAQARAALAQAWKWKDGLLFQNAKFDTDVAETHWGMKPLPWDKVHDTLFLLFLDDPNQNELGLKPSANRLLKMPAEEQDAVGAWLTKNQPVPGIKISLSKDSDHYFGRYIAYAPGDLVGRYAIGDVVRTERLFDLLYDKNAKRGMQVAYDRERRLMPILLQIERQGVRVDLKRLRADVGSYNRTRREVEGWLMKQLKSTPETLNLNSGPQLVKALVKVGKIDLKKLGVTATGRAKTDKESMTAAVTDKILLPILKYYRQLNTCLNTFMEPWLKTAEQSKGLIFTYWNQVKGNDVGARTGRLSSSPNFQNMPKEFKALFHHDDPTNKTLPKCPLKLPALPLCRGYVVPFEPGHVLLDRDYSQQEPRILAHFEAGNLMSQYVADPWIDFHENARQHLERILERPFDRKVVKTINLGLIYGMGIGKMAEKNETTVEETKAVKKAILAMYPGLKEMYSDMRVRAMTHRPIRTWGGRECYCEPPRFVDGQMKTYDYRMVNTLIQGSAADCTKEAIVRYWSMKPKADRLLLNVHDEVVISAPAKTAHKSMEVLRKAMESVEFDVKILSEGKFSKRSWADLVDCDKKGKSVKKL